LKRILFVFTCLIVLTQVARAQNFREEKIAKNLVKTFVYPKGGDSLQFVISEKNDTLKTTNWYPNGKPSYILWQLDSCFRFDIWGRVIEKKYELYTVGRSLLSKITMVYYKNGNLEYTSKNLSNNYYYNKYDENGELRYSEHTQKLPKISLTKVKDKLGRLRKSVRVDTLEIINEHESLVNAFDTIFYPNGNVYRIEITDNNKVISNKYFDKNGVFQKDYAKDIPQEINLFKDNLNCFYGLKTSKGDTILKPQYERIESYRGHFWKVYTGNTFSLLLPDGSPIKSSINKMTDITLLERYASFTKTENNEDLPDNISIDTSENRSMFSYRIEGDKKGVIDDAGNDVVPPQYCQHIEGHYFNNTQYFQLYTEDSIVYLDSKGSRLLDGKSVAIYSAFKDDYCFFSDAKPRDIVFGNNRHFSYDIDIYITSRSYSDNENVLFGLCKLDGHTLLNAQFCSIHSVLKSPLFVTSTKVKQLENPTYEDKEKPNVEENILVHHGIYNAATQKWALSPKSFTIHNLPFFVDQKYNYFLIEDTLQKKYGLMDLEGRLILPFEFDTIILKTNINLGWFKKKGKYQIFKVEEGKAVINEAQYTYLNLFDYENSRKDDSPYRYFLAKNNDKWGIVDVQSNIIKPFEFDYASLNGNDIVLIKKDTVYNFNFESLPNEKVFSFYSLSSGWCGTRLSSLREIPNKLRGYSLIDNPDKIVIINDLGKIVVPPQYKIINSTNEYILFENEKKERKILFTKTGNTFDFPFSYDIVAIEENKPFIKVSDAKTGLQGLVTIEGKLIFPCVYHRIESTYSKDSIFFLQKEAPIADISQSWMMYDMNGKRMNDVYFNEPISFFNAIGLGIGHEGAYANIYHKSGLVLRPFKKNNDKTDTINSEIKFKKIKHILGSANYIFFYQQGLYTMMLMTNFEGEILVEGGRYETISPFCNNYALTLKDKKIGLINRKGEEIIAPQNMRQATQFLDSMKCYSDYSLEQKHQIWNNKGQYSFLGFPFRYSSRQGDDFTKQQWYALKNILVERYSALLFIEDYYSKKEDRESFSNPYEHKEMVYIDCLALSDSFMSCKIDHKFSNFYNHNGNWEDLTAQNLFNFDGTKRQALNGLLTQKIKELKDAFINCSDPSNFLGQVENSFMTTKNGIDFYFDSTKSSKYYEIVSLSWAELSPFLKIKITDK
jgi:WG containing repeat